jgi:hypothetical protein
MNNDNLKFLSQFAIAATVALSCFEYFDLVLECVNQLKMSDGLPSAGGLWDPILS